MSLNGTPDTDYLYNALGERVKKAPAATPTAGTCFHYDRDGKLRSNKRGRSRIILASNGVRVDLFFELP